MDVTPSLLSLSDVLMDQFDLNTIESCVRLLRTYLAIESDPKVTALCKGLPPQFSWLQNHESAETLSRSASVFDSERLRALREAVLCQHVFRTLQSKLLESQSDAFPMPSEQDVREWMALQSVPVTIHPTVLDVVRQICSLSELELRSLDRVIVWSTVSRRMGCSESRCRHQWMNRITANNPDWTEQSLRVIQFLPLNSSVAWATVASDLVHISPVENPPSGWECFMQWYRMNQKPLQNRASKASPVTCIKHLLTSASRWGAIPYVTHDMHLKGFRCSWTDCKTALADQLDKHMAMLTRSVRRAERVDLWSEFEIAALHTAFEICPYDWKMIASLIETRSAKESALSISRVRLPNAHHMCWFG